MTHPWLRWLVGLVALGLLGAAAVRLYSTTSPWQPYATATHRYLSLGMDADSTTLAAQSVGAEPSAWVLAARRQNAALLRGWAGSNFRVRAGHRNGDTVLVSLEPRTAGGCAVSNRLTAGFLEGPGQPRPFVLESRCVKGFTSADIAPIEIDLAPEPRP
jgi:hypothetical protein